MSFNTKANSKKFKKLNFILDSGSNEFMFNNTSYSTETLKPIQIETAKKAGSQAGIENAFFGKTKELFLPNLTKVEVGKNNRGVFSEELNKNLGSVGRIAKTICGSYSQKKDTT